MASYQAKRRDPLLDRKTQAVLERRGRELLGIGLIGLGVATGLMLASYAPDDPSWLSATDADAENLLGRIGAAIASPLTVIMGFAAWSLAALALAWGLRFVLHIGAERAFSRVIFAPIAVALTAIFAATHVPPGGWTHSFGLGGLFGDTVLGALIGIAPFGTGLSLRLLSLLSGAAAVGLMLFVTGWTLRELRLAGRFLAVGTVLAYAQAAQLAAHGAEALVRSGREAAQRLAERRRAGPAPRGFGAPRPLGTGQAEPQLQGRAGGPAPSASAAAAAMPRAERPGLLSRLPGVARLAAQIAPMPEPELVEPAPALAAAIGAPSEDRVRVRIATAIQNRMSLGKPVRPVEIAPARRVEPPLTAAHRAGATARTLDPVPEEHEDRLFAAYDAHRPSAAPARPVEPRPADQSVYAPKPVVQTQVRQPQPSRQAQAERQPALPFEGAAPPAYEPPPLSLLSSPVEIRRNQLSNEALEENARMLETVLDDYGVKGEIVSVRPGPVVTMYELEPAPGVKASRVIGLADDIARSMSALSARVSTVPGRSVIGIELPNAHREKVVLREILSSRDFGDSQMRLPLALGKDIAGEPVVANLAKMPHLLIAGTTGSGKSVAINTMILSLLYKLSPEECRLIMIDPKMLELSVYDGIPHLLSPVVTDPKKAVVALKWVVGEMEERYRKMSKMGVRNIEGYNGRVADALARGETFSRTVQTGFDDETGDPVFETEEITPVKLPYIVVIVDEMADLMMVAGKEIEACIQRLAQMARASGIHLIMATQRPSVDVITGTIKANFPTRISFQVTSKIDSRTILGEMGAEQLLGQGDMLYMAGGGRIARVHGPFVSDEEVEEVVSYLKSYGPPEYVGSVVEGPDDDKADDIDLVLGLGSGESDDALYDQAVAVVLKDRKVSTSYIQRKLGIGYNKAARLVEQMEEQGLVSPANHVGKREILVPEA
ncbi:MAG: DNA translocase FtsK 4TM domain-containing protein [Rhodobacteraceae bacterium]|nr:DNA translocase FtsK 4TM domain-containing protein [Paracoccaceae bacterium]